MTKKVKPLLSGAGATVVLVGAAFTGFPFIIRYLVFRFVTLDDTPVDYPLPCSVRIVEKPDMAIRRATERGA